MRPLTAEQEAEILRVYAECGEKRETGRRTGRSWAAVNRVVEASKTAALSTRVDSAGPKPTEAEPSNDAVLSAAIQRNPLTVEELARVGKVTTWAAWRWLGEKREAGYTILQRGETFQWVKASPSGNAGGRVLEYVSRPDNTFVFGACGDQHLGSKYERLDVLDDLYDEFAKAGVDRVYNAGNWIDGEAPFNMFDLHVHGMDQQLRYLAEHYPQRAGIHTYAIAGNDHEGWYSKKIGVDIGQHAERVMRQSGRDDWTNIGYMQANVTLVNANSGKSCSLCVMHPGGGSAYAVSYKPQKIVEGFSGGEKPAVLLIGHYHKLSVNLIRNVWALQTGCSQDQTPFMMQKLIEPHVGGMTIRLEQDPRTGAIIRCVPDIRNYFVRSYYNGRWSMSEDVTLPERSVA